MRRAAAWHRECARFFGADDLLVFPEILQQLGNRVASPASFLSDVDVIRTLIGSASDEPQCQVALGAVFLVHSAHGAAVWIALQLGDLLPEPLYLLAIAVMFFLGG